MNVIDLFFRFAWLIVPIALLGVGVLGVFLDREHRKDLAYRRAELGHIMVVNLKTLPGIDTRYATALMTGDVVLSANRLITTIAKFKLFIGGEVKSYHDLLTRARQEAQLRLMENAAAAGYDAIANVRFEAVDMAGVTTRGSTNNKQGIYTGLIAYGTAYRRLPDIYPPPAAPTLVGYV